MAVKPSITTESWLLRQLSRLQHRHPEMVNPVLDRLLDEDEKLRWALLINAYLDEQISLGKVAELLGMSEMALRQKFVALGVPVRHGPVDIEAAQVEVDALHSWFDDEQ